MENEIKLITEKQVNYYLGLCKRKHISPIGGYENWTSAQASAMIESLNSTVATAQKVVEQVQAVREERVQRESEIKEENMKPFFKEMLQDSSKPVQALDKATVGMCFKLVFHAWVSGNKNIQAQNGQFVREVLEAYALVKSVNTELVKMEFGAGNKPLVFQDYSKHDQPTQMCPGCGALEFDECDKTCPCRGEGY